MSHLIPEIRVNKNGVPVRRHVKPPSAASTKALKSLPTPSVAQAAPLDKRINRILSGGLNVHSGIARTRLEAKLSKMDEDEVQRFEWLIDNADKYEGHPDTYRRFVKDVIDDTPENRTLYMNAIEALGIEEHLEDWADTRALRMFRKIPEFAPYAEDLREAPDDIIKRVINLGRYRHEFGASMLLFANTNTRFRLHSRELESLVINEPERAEELVKWAGKHYQSDPSRYIDSAIALRIIKSPDDRDTIAQLINEDRIRESFMINLILDYPDSKQEILELRSSGVDRREPIEAVITGNVKSTLASGVL